MLIDTDRPVHLTYCTNVHPGDSWSEVREGLQSYLPKLKARIAPNKPLGVGLRLSDRAARDLLAQDELPQWRAWLDDQGLYVFTLNGFVYGGFYRQAIKDRVYFPDWTTAQRVDYTRRLATILSGLLPKGIDGGISTSPLSYKPWLPHDAVRKAALQKSAVNLSQTVATLIDIRDATGQLIHIDIEPEPDGLLENSREVVSFYQDWLLPIGGHWLAAQAGVSCQVAEIYLKDHIRLCYDTCHFAVAFEEAEVALRRFQAFGIRVGKYQLSTALQVALTGTTVQRGCIAQRLLPFAESTYLHQVIERRADGTLVHYPDLAEALPMIGNPAAQEWRIHFHVPIFLSDYQGLASTQSHLSDILRLLPDDRDCAHLEIETYTWDVLPPPLKTDLVTLIQREYAWVLTTLINSSHSHRPACIEPLS